MVYNLKDEVNHLVKIYFIRHCEAEGNKAKIFQGSTDCDVSDKGARQLEYLNKRFENIHIDKAIASPLKRAYKTALAAAEGKGLEVIADPDFTEIHGGFIEGMTFKKIFSDYAELERIWQEEPQNFAPDKGEPMRKVFDRAKKAIHKVAEDPENEGKTILIASHGAVTKCLMCYLVLGDVERLIEIPWANNTAVSYIEYEKGKFEVKYYNDDSHIPQDFSTDVEKLWESEEEK